MKQIILAVGFLITLTVDGFAAQPNRTVRETVTVQGVVTRGYDADTFWVEEKNSEPATERKIRVHGADAPELRQPCKVDDVVVKMCGVIARDVVLRTIIGNTVRCDIVNPTYDRDAARCTVMKVHASLPTEQGTAVAVEILIPDLGLWLIQQGLAYADERYAPAEYKAAQAEAIANRRGFWNNAFDDPKQGFQFPAQWRWEQRRPRQQ